MCTYHAGRLQHISEALLKLVQLDGDSDIAEITQRIIRTEIWLWLHYIHQAVS